MALTVKVLEALPSWQGFFDTIINWVLTTGVKLILGILALLILFKVTNKITKRLYGFLRKKAIDETIARVSTQFFKILIKLIFVIMLVGYIGVETASISALIASIGVGLSLALQGALSNFAGGLIIIVMRPFKLGDYILSNDEEGTVENIKLFYTEIATVDNKKVLIPNGILANDVIVNYSSHDIRRTEIIVPISYESSIDIAKKAISKAIDADIRILRHPEPFINVSEYSSSVINLKVRVWAKNVDLWPVHWLLLENIKKELDDYSIVIPYNQLDVNIKNKSAT
ncbi:MAG: mechanosensitive ion channel [Acholeplasmatales bacterium]|nr:mechanosensitive ion channel [Acholeplasmatales bacterium]